MTTTPEFRWWQFTQWRRGPNTLTREEGVRILSDPCVGCGDPEPVRITGTCLSLEGAFPTCRACFTVLCKDKWTVEKLRRVGEEYRRRGSLVPAEGHKRPMDVDVMERLREVSREMKS